MEHMDVCHQQVKGVEPLRTHHYNPLLEMSHVEFGGIWTSPESTFDPGPGAFRAPCASPGV